LAPFLGRKAALIEPIWVAACGLPQARSVHWGLTARSSVAEHYGKPNHSAYQPDICKYRPAGALEGDHGLAKETLTSVFGSIRFTGSATPT
jgi:hypothetical protein